MGMLHRHGKDTPRTHPVCWLCKTPIDFTLAHCDSRHCPWCKACHRARTEAGRP